jgi:hypothetical protein
MQTWICFLRVLDPRDIFSPDRVVLKLEKWKTICTDSHKFYTTNIFAPNSMYLILKAHFIESSYFVVNPLFISNYLGVRVKINRLGFVYEFGFGGLSLYFDKYLIFIKT